MPISVHADAGRRGAGLLPHGMRHVADLVPEHRGELRLRVEVREDAARDVHVASRQRERVDLFAVEHRERELHVWPVADGDDALAEVAHVGLQRLVLE